MKNITSITVNRLFFRRWRDRLGLQLGALRSTFDLTILLYIGIPGLLLGGGPTTGSGGTSSRPGSFRCRLRPFRCCCCSWCTPLAGCPFISKPPTYCFSGSAPLGQGAAAARMDVVHGKAGRGIVRGFCGVKPAAGSGVRDELALRRRLVCRGVRPQSRADAAGQFAGRLDHRLAAHHI